MEVKKCMQYKKNSKMQALFRKIAPPKLKSNECAPDTDYKGFDCADSLEGGSGMNIFSDWLQPVKECELYLIRRRLKEWILLDYKTLSFIMRACVDFEQNGVFVGDFEPRVAAGNPGRIRVSIYLQEAPCDPSVLMISSLDRIQWTILKASCELCRYKRRRSSFTEGSETSPMAPPECTSPCSFSRPSNGADFGDICVVVPSGLELMRMRHVQLAVRQCVFTQISVNIPTDGGWCPVARPPLADKTSSPAVLQLTSVSPIWSDQFKALALEFRQRNVLPSRRNFQLQGPDRPVVQHYRTGRSEYTIEVAPPLSLVHAFCIALSTVLWV